MSVIRVAHVINSAGLGGVPEAAYQLLRALPAERYDRRLYLLRRPAGPHPGRDRRLERVRALGVPVAFPEPDAEIVAALAGWLRAEGVQILHTHSYRPNRFGRLAGAAVRAEGLKVVCHYHNQYDDKWSVGDSLRVERALARHTDAMLACSASVRDHAAAALGLAAERIQVLLNGVDMGRLGGPGDRAAARAALGLPAHGPIIGLVGRLCAQKGQEDLIRAAPAILRAHPRATFALAGDADDPATEARLRALADELGVSAAVRFLGFIERVDALYAALDVLAAPSRWEGFGLVLAEAMAAGLPVVAARAGAIPEVVGDAALLVPPADPAALALALTKLLANPALPVALIARGRARAGRFSWARAGEQLDALYRQLVGRGAP